jgi:phage shock protein C
MVSRLFRPRTDRMIAGVCAGLGLYFGIDPVIVRLLFVVLALTTGITVMLYPILWLIMPEGAPAQTLPPGARFDPQTGQPLPYEPSSIGQTTRLPADPAVAPPMGNRNRILAIVLVGVGALILLDRLGDLIGLDTRGVVVPLLLVGLGVYLLRGTKV